MLNEETSSESAWNLLRRLVSVWLVAAVGLLLTIIVARFTGLFLPYWGVEKDKSTIEQVVSIFGSDLIRSFLKSWPLALIMMPLYAFNVRKAIRFICWVLIGLIYAGLAFGGYVRGGDFSGMVMAPYGLVCGLLFEPFHNYVWHGVKWLHEQKVMVK